MDASQAVNPFITLPVEVLRFVEAFLDPQSKWRVRQVCRLAKDLWPALPSCEDVKKIIAPERIKHLNSLHKKQFWAERVIFPKQKWGEVLGFIFRELHEELRSLEDESEKGAELAQKMREGDCSIELLQKVESHLRNVNLVRFFQGAFSLKTPQIDIRPLRDEGTYSKKARCLRETLEDTSGKYEVRKIVADHTEIGTKSEEFPPITRIPSEVKYFSALKVLKIEDNQILCFPEGLRKIPQILLKGNPAFVEKEESNESMENGLGLITVIFFVAYFTP